MTNASEPAMTVPGFSTGSIEARPGVMDDATLIAHLLLVTAPAGACLAQAQAAMKRHGSLTGLFRAAAAGKCAAEPGEVYELVIAAQELLRRQLNEKLLNGQALTSPAETIDFLRLHLGHRRREVFLCIFLDTRHRVISCDNLFLGSIDGASVYPRVVAEHALRHNAAAVIVAHNHPSGVAEPSLADQAITRRLKDALGLLEIRLLDHFIIGSEEPVSMASRGMI
ncbi:MAG: DNA repair protein RadC [Xanthomonadales bacterium]|nr:DNA repair protein RadC [Gammaproteobacteria bacterium]NNE04675.1 DNA repair protein RadC [Xanthomonadales bacterium]NNL96341.1 DNA repair protein RadC [Xanthomonadales bacterium]